MDCSQDILTNENLVIHNGNLININKVKLSLITQQNLCCVPNSNNIENTFLVPKLNAYIPPHRRH